MTAVMDDAVLADLIGGSIRPESFWDQVDRSGDCWLWTGRRDENGYGRIGHRRVGAHRVAWALSHGGDLPDQWVLHRCDNPPCVRPDHLFLGDALDNNRDRQQKGRTRGWAGRSGGEHHAYVITPEVEQQMRSMRAERATQQTIADAFGVSRGHVARIVSGVLPRHTKGGVR
ncbi:MAG: HNH endonuclease signature motif containing protein [Micropruina sp.]|uniref:HNH endonuclease signature motif containing protein n=1 Tax=Micropruina sp. TaxID=2737536 RepID=UPI0039E7242E